MDLRAVKGMNDVLPADIAAWHRIERAYAQTMAFWGELAYVDLLQPPFHFHFVDQPDA